MCKVKCGISCMSFFYGLLVLLPLSLTSLLLSIDIGNNYNCNYVDPLGLNISGYLVGMCFSYGLMSLSLMSYVIYKDTGNDSCPSQLHRGIIWLTILFDICWIFVGGFIIIRSNSYCISSDNPIVIYAVCIWALSLIQLVANIVIFNHYTSPPSYIYSRNYENF